MAEEKEVSEKALRFNTGKFKASYIPTFFLRGFCRVMEYGQNKYKIRGNWLKGGDIDQYLDSLGRHLEGIQLYFEGGQEDPRLLHDVESWLDHPSMLIFNAIALRLSLMRNPKVKLKLDPEFNTNPAKSKKEVDVKAFLDKMEELYPGAKSEWMDMILSNDYGYKNK